MGAPKYRDKLDRKAKEEGHGSVDELTQAYKDKIASLRKQAAVPGATAPLGSANPQAQTQNLPFHPHRLHSILRTWHPRPATRPPLPLSIPLSQDASTTPGRQDPLLLPRPRQNRRPPNNRDRIHLAPAARLLPFLPMCGNPVPNLGPDPYNRLAAPPIHPAAPREGQGAEIHFLQWTFPHPNVASVLFTHLAEYKLRGEFASPHTTVNVHLELKEDKGVALVQGQVVEGRGVSVEEAKWLLMCLQKFYGLQGEEESRRRLLEQFSKGDGGFRVEELLEEAEKIV
ncbi:hypothetical protein H2199_003286 [Coniosporium tulheliwenetii]|uniref:Uncharacterized protein n=1 Tax=Coniosporium tulheliwenetii TaxID=3383036 RepID=A0ACC2ZDB0_9PEZI|nr:hypothetical protein H2199_003286 [Cladosporium sp. JES 115]